METIMNKYLKRESTGKNWRYFINYQKHFADKHRIRKAYKRAVEYSKESKEEISEEWISWEKCFGAIADIENAFNFVKSKNLKDETTGKPKLKNIKVKKTEK